tara:strand:+ start:238 stop:561 length:324 start_codon:yes stop_codon:yes gene_type:complete
MIMPFAIFFAAIFEGVNPLFAKFFLFLLILPSANFFHIYYKKKKDLLLKAGNFIVIAFCIILIIYGFGPIDTNSNWFKIIVAMIYLIFNINYVYISDEKKFWLNSEA